MVRKSQAGAPSLWGPQIMLVIGAGHRNPVTVVTFGLLKLEHGGSPRRFCRGRRRSSSRQSWA
eukprot:447860-Pyramimonas_sp.AAC.1